MEKKPPTLKNIAEELSSEGYIGRAQQRASRRRSLWNLVLIPFVFGGAALVTIALFQVMWHIHVTIYPDHVNQLREFWGEGVSAASFISSLLLLLPLMIASFPISMLITNSVVWLIPPARRALDKEAEGVKWASFRESMQGLWSITRILVPVCLLLSLVGAATLQNLR